MTDDEHSEIVDLLNAINGRVQKVEIKISDHDYKLDEVKDIVNAYASVKALGHLSRNIVAGLTTISGLFVAWHDFIRK